MGYASHTPQVWRFETITAADNAGATGDGAATKVFTRAETVTRIGVYITTVLGAGAMTVAFDRRILLGSDTGRVDAYFGSVIAPATTPVGKVVVKDVLKDADAGDELVEEVTVASASGGFIPFCESIPREETHPNQADVIVSA